MMSEKNNGGPAFPVPGDQHDESFNGMSLRDYFAVKAMHGWIAASDSAERNYTDPGDVARNAYAYADAMLAARDA